jgi:hypothetical protein
MCGLASNYRLPEKTCIGKGANEEMKTKYHKKETLKNLALTALLSVNKHQDTP